MRASVTVWAMVAVLGLAGAAGAQHAGAPGERVRSAAALASFPQPVRVGDLAGRQVLEDTQQQRVLGRVVGVARRGEGELVMLIDAGGVLGWGVRRIAVPLTDTALLGVYVVMVRPDAAGVAALPVAAPGAAMLAAEEVVRIGLTRN